MQINNPLLIAGWVNDFKIADPDALKAKKRGGRSNMAKSKIINNNKANECSITSNDDTPVEVILLH